MSYNHFRHQPKTSQWQSICWAEEDVDSSRVSRTKYARASHAWQESMTRVTRVAGICMSIINHRYQVSKSFNSSAKPDAPSFRPRHPIWHHLPGFRRRKRQVESHPPPQAPHPVVLKGRREEDEYRIAPNLRPPPNYRSPYF